MDAINARVRQIVNQYVGDSREDMSVSALFAVDAMAVHIVELEKQIEALVEELKSKNQ